MNAKLCPRGHVLATGYFLASLGLFALPAGVWAQQANPLRPEPASTHSDAAVLPASAQQPIPAPRVVRRPAVRARTSARPVTFGANTPVHGTRGFVPRHEMMADMPLGEPMPMEVLPGQVAGDMMLNPLPVEGEMMGPDCCDTIPGDCGGCGTCNGCLVPCPRFALNHFEFFAGAQGFTGPPNRGETGSFGFYYGVNWAAPVPCLPCEPIGMQFGFRGTSSNYSGSSLSADTRNQVFLTAGLFRRVDWGFQGGIVVDYVRDDWFYDVELTQVRGELSWVYPQCHELGFWFASSTKSQTVPTVIGLNDDVNVFDDTYEPTDLFAFFYRRRFQQLCGGYGRVYAGFSGKSDGLIGADVKLPLTSNWALEGGFTYLIPQEGNRQIAFVDEAWNVAVGLVWYPGGRKSVGTDYSRPLFNVADNGSFMIKLSDLDN